MVTVGSSNIINVVLQADQNILEEVVVTGYGIERQKKTLTYQAEKVDSDELVVVAPTRWRGNWVVPKTLPSSKRVGFGTRGCLLQT